MELAKLKSLTLVSLASSSPSHCLSYSSLLSRLELPSQRELESLVIAAISSGLLSARLDQQRQLVEVDSCIGRDVAPGEVSEMRAAVGQWLAQVDDVLLELDRHMEQLRHTQQAASTSARRDDDDRSRVVALLTAARNGQMTELPKHGEMLGGVRVDAQLLQAIQLVTGGGTGEGKATKREAGARGTAGGDKEREGRGDKGRKRLGGWVFGRG